MLFSLIGGNVPGIKNIGQRIISLLAAVYLLAILLTWVVPHLFPRPEVSQASADGRALRAGDARRCDFLRAHRNARRPPLAYSVDLFYSLLLFLMVVVLVLGAFVIKEVSHGNYVVALAQALIVIAGLLVALSLLWDPRAGFAGIGQLLTRYFLSIGMPFERWMHSLAALADRERDPDKFVVVAAHEMSELPWLSGDSLAGRGVRRQWPGDATKYATAFTFGGLDADALHPLVAQSRAGAAHAPAGAFAGRLLRRQDARAGTAAQCLRPGNLRDRIAPHPRREESAADAALPVRRCRDQRRGRCATRCAC